MAEEHIVLESDGTSQILMEDGTGSIVGENHEEPAGGGTILPQMILQGLYVSEANG